jgi:hypothetical protein
VGKGMLLFSRQECQYAQMLAALWQGELVAALDAVVEQVDF